MERWGKGRSREEFWISQEGNEGGVVKRRRKKGKKKGQRKLLFWNVVGIGNKDREF